MRWLFLAAVLLAAASGGARAAERTVSELEVQPEPKCVPIKAEPGAPTPKVVSTFPANGATVRPGILVVRVTFDRPMACRGFFVEVDGVANPCPGSHQKQVMSFNRRTIRLVCATGPNRAYGITVGARALQAFVSLAGRAAEPYEVTFTTSDGPPVTSIPESLAQDR